VGPWLPSTKLLLVTEQTRKLFESERISGLEYEPCEDLDEASEPIFVARVIHAAHYAGTDIVTKPCKEHSIIMGAFVFDFHTPREGIHDVDFQMIDRVKVGKREYWYNLPFLVVSQKLLKLLLKHKVPKLQRRAIRLNQKFVPLIVS
jgi:hypothetical protein